MFITVGISIVHVLSVIQIVSPGFLTRPVILVVALLSATSVGNGSCSHPVFSGTTLTGTEIALLCLGGVPGACIKTEIYCVPVVPAGIAIFGIGKAPAAVVVIV